MKDVILKLVNFKDNGEYRVMVFSGDEGAELTTPNKEIAQSVHEFCKALWAQMKIETCAPFTELTKDKDGYTVAAVFNDSGNTLLFRAKDKQIAESAKIFIQDFADMARE